tara:strand:+ start:386 stop:655 length:270 start_codon:yes stop_codon:yes gene_type:complete
MATDPWQCRYDVKKEDQISRILEDQELVKYFNAKSIAAIPGASIYLENGGYVRMDVASWNWLRPLLEELRDFRRENVDGKEVPKKKSAG